MCWYFKKRQVSLDFFSGHGFKTFAAAYYDADTWEKTEKNAEGWMAAMDTAPGATGIMYTTWRLELHAAGAVCRSGFQALIS